ncbi:MAG: AAC(3) family N-acetyltransferase [Allosphingosinicella sp.]
MVHASLRKAGLVRSRFGSGGADLLLDVLDRAVGPAGTLLMVLGTHYAQDHVNLRPVDERAQLLAGTDPLDLEDAPAMPDIGWLAEAFRRRPGTILSDNPSGRFGARGAGAAALLSGQPWHDYYGPGSPLERLCDRGGRILRIGADPDTITALHFAEYLARVPDKRRTRWDYLLAGEQGARHVWVECLDDNGGIRPWPGEDYFALILRAYLATGRARIGPVGDAVGELIYAADIVAFGAGWMERHLR